jgi:hypothetical protein
MKLNYKTSKFFYPQFSENRNNVCGCVHPYRSKLVMTKLFFIGITYSANDIKKPEIAEKLWKAKIAENRELNIKTKITSKI